MRTCWKIILILASLFVLSGCSVAGMDAETIMRPPKATGEQAGIQAALEKTASGNVTFKYPRTGEYRSAIIMHDLDGDGEKEAIAFFRPQTEGSGAHMCVLAKRDGIWMVLNDIVGPGVDVDRVMFGDFNKNKTVEIVVGWSLLTTRDKSCSIYELNKGKVNELMANEFYTEMEVFDIDGDGKDELLTVFSAESSIARLLAMNGSTIEKVSDVRLDPAITSYLNVQTMKLDRETPSMILDGYVSTGTLATEILYWDKEQQKLVAPFNEEATGSVIYSRNVSFHPTDVNKDGFIDFPKQITLPGSDALARKLPEGTSVSSLIEWSAFNKRDGTFTVVRNTLIGPTEDVWLNVDPWADQLDSMIALQNDASRSMSIHELDQKTNEISGPLFEIQAFGQYVWDQKGENTAGFVTLKEHAGIVFAIRFHDKEKITYSMQSLIINCVDIRTA